MNQGYINSKDGTTIVTDENGEMLKRDGTVSGDELVLENKLEKVQGQIEQITNKKHEYEAMKFGTKFMLIAQFIVVLFAASVGFGVNGLYGLIYALLLSLVACGVNSLYWGLVYPIANRKLKGTIAKLEKAKELEKTFEEELEKAKELPKEEVKDEPVSLKNRNNFEFAQIEKDLKEAYYDAVHSRPKKRVRRKEKNKD